MPLPTDEALLPPPAEREELIFAFDADNYNFRALVLEMFRATFAAEDLVPSHGAGMKAPPPHAPGVGSADQDVSGVLLSNLHRTPVRVADYTSCYATVLGGGAGCGVGRGAALLPLSPHLLRLRARFQDMLRRFVRNVVAPMLGCAPDDIAFQRFPVLRVGVPSKKPLNPKHCDAQYHHQAGELNFWMPLTAVWGHNTLHVESVPGRGDYHPLELGWGRVARFWGNRCRHYCVPNDTGFTRVSIDFRAMPVARFDRNFMDSNGHATFLRLGEYYACCCEGGAETADFRGTQDDGDDADEAGRVRAAAAMKAAAAAAGGGIWARR